MKTTPISKTSKGHRIWLQGIAHKGDRFNVTFTESAIWVEFTPHGKRKVCQAKGGIVDIVSKRVTQWAHGATEAFVVEHDPKVIRIERGM